LKQKRPIAHTDRFMGASFPSRYEDVRTIAYDTEHFSSAASSCAKCARRSSRRRITSAALVEGKDR
jgi:hypothetical protein